MFDDETEQAQYATRRSKPPLFPVSKRRYRSIDSLGECSLCQTGFLPSLSHKDLIWRGHSPNPCLRFRECLTKIWKYFTSI